MKSLFDSNGATMGQTIEKVMKEKLETFENAVIDIQMLKVEALREDKQ